MKRELIYAWFSLMRSYFALNAIDYVLRDSVVSDIEFIPHPQIQRVEISGA
jgi:hypothetical protein